MTAELFCILPDHYGGFYTCSQLQKERTESQKNDRTIGTVHRKRGRPVYICENCGAHEFRVSHSFAEGATVIQSLPCTCDSDTDEAATREILIERARMVSGLLGEDHRVSLDEEEEEPETEQEQVDVVITCPKCFKRARLQDWTSQTPEFEKLDEREYWEVRCDECDHEVEFGWSHPERGGRLWPCEAVDFNPWKSIPEARFTEGWKRRGWLRPLTRSGAREQL